MLVEWILAVMFLNQPNMKPELVAPMVDKASCMEQIDAQTKEWREILKETQREFVCLQVVRKTI